MNHYPFKTKEELMKYQEENPDFIIPISYDYIGRNILKRNKKLLTLIINNVLRINFKEDDILVLDGRVEVNTLNEKQREADVFVHVQNNYINIELNRSERLSDTLNKKNMGYVADMLKRFGDGTIYQINLNTYDSVGLKQAIYVSQIMTKEGIVRYESLIIYDVTIPILAKMCYTNNEIYEERFLLLMRIFMLDSRKEIQEIIKDDPFLKEVYHMQERLNKEDFILEHFSDEEFHKQEKKEYLEIGREEGREEGRKEGIKEGITKAEKKEFNKKP